MKTSAARILLCSGCLWSALIINMNGQTPPATKEEPKRDFAIKIGVEEVRIDAVVLDNKGRQINDLTADDFELYQDGRPQKIISCTYVNEYKKPASGELPGATQSTSELPKEEVRRTFVFVIDDIRMCFDYFNYARMALKKFVETQMQPGDQVAIIQNGQGIGAFQRFTSDRGKLISLIKNLWPPPSPCAADTVPRGGGGAPMFLPVQDDILIKDKKPLGQLKESFDAQTAALDYAIRALQDMPGRKSLVFMSSNIMGVGPDYLYDEMADRALRAGVVIYTLDMKGLMISGGNSASDRYLPLSKKTGGILVENSNFFIHGVRPVDEASKGYYLLSYIPPANTFHEKNDQDIYHRVKVKVKRRGAEVHSRDGFLGTTNPSKAVLRATTLQEAIVSPFMHNDLELRLSSGYAYAPKPGYFLRSWLHLDGTDLTFTNEKNGGHILSLELMTLTANGEQVQDSKGQQYRFMLDNVDISRIRKEGIDLNTYLPVKNPGKYYVRAAVRDMDSGKIGSCYQYLQIQEVKNRRLSLSSLFVLTPDENMYSIISGSVAMDRFSDIARKWEASRTSPARRSYMAGEGFDYMAILYNPKSKGSPALNLESQLSIFKDGKEFYKGNPEGIDPRGIDDLGRIPIIKRLDLNSQMEEGTYQLQLKIEEKQAKGKSNNAFQTIDFEIRK
jgi:VWFA-related protein